jgi:hypothetical protein
MELEGIICQESKDINQPCQYIRSTWPPKKTKLHGLSPRANCTDRATATCWQSDCQLLRIKGATWSA